MKEKLIGIGMGGQTRVMIDIILKEKKYNIVGFVEKQISSKKILDKYQIIGTDKDLNKLFNKGVKNVFIGVASLDNTKKNKKIYLKLKNIGFNIINVVHQSSIISSDTIIGDGVKVFAGSVINPGTKIGSNVLINSGSIVEHDCKISDHVQISPGACLGGAVSVGEGSIVGLGSRVIQGVSIGNYCMIGAGTVVTKDIPNNSLVYGIPAKRIKSWLSE